MGALLALAVPATGQVNNDCDFTPYTFTTLAGAAGALGRTDGADSSARFASPAGVAVDASGNLYVADSGNSTIRRISPDGVVTTVAGLAGITGSADGVGSAARFYFPQGVAVDRTGVLYVADTNNLTIRRIALDGTVTTFAGRTGAFGNTDGVASDARFGEPLGVAVDPTGVVYVADGTNHSVRKITPDGTVSTPARFPANTGTPNPADGVRSVAVDAAGNVYAADSISWTTSVRKIAPNGVLTTLAACYGPLHLAADGPGNIYLASAAVPTVQRIAPDGGLSRLTGPGAGESSGAEFAAPFVNPGGMAADADGNVYVADRSSETIRKGHPDLVAPVMMKQPVDRTVTAGGNAAYSVTAEFSFPATHQWQWKAPGSATWANLSDGGAFGGATTGDLRVAAGTAAMNGGSVRCVITNSLGGISSQAATLTVLGGQGLTVTTLAGKAGTSGSADGTGDSARFYSPADVAVDRAGNIYVADTYNQTIRKITPAGSVTTLAGQAGIYGSADGTGSAARFLEPAGVGVDANGNVFVADTDNSAIRKISPAGVVTTLAGRAGAGNWGSSDDTGSAARFDFPSGVVADAAGDLFVADTNNCTIRKVTSGGVVTTLAGQARVGGQTDGNGSAAQFAWPQGLALDGAGNLYVADSDAIRRVVIASGAVTKVAGSSRAAYGIPPNDGPAAQAQFNSPCGVAVDSSGNLYVADTDDHTIRQISPAGIVTTIAGLSGSAGSADGVGTGARFNYPTGITVDGAGNLLIADTNNHLIRLAYFASAPGITGQPQSQTVTVGSSVQFSVVTAGKPAPAHQWFFNGSAISGATSSTLNLANVQAANAGNYTVAVTNASGSVASSAATLTVNAASSGTDSGSSSSGGGGGAMECWFAALMSLLVGARAGWPYRNRHP